MAKTEVVSSITETRTFAKLAPSITRARAGFHVSSHVFPRLFFSRIVSARLRSIPASVDRSVAASKSATTPCLEPRSKGTFWLYLSPRLRWNVRAVIWKLFWIRFGPHGYRLWRKPAKSITAVACSQKVKSWLRDCDAVPKWKTTIHKAPRAVPAGTAPGTFRLPFRQPWRAAVSAASSRTATVAHPAG